MIQKKEKKTNGFLTGLLSFAMTTTLFYVPSPLQSNDNVAEALSAGNSRTFNNTSTGHIGANVDNSVGTLGGSISMSGGMYLWTVPETGFYRIESRGAQGGSQYSNGIGGYGAVMRGDMALSKGEVIKILVGQSPSKYTSSHTNHSSGGGGGTFVVKNAGNVPLVVAGGGGGSHTGYNGVNASTSTSGTVSSNGSGTPGTNGNGGTYGYSGSGGGFYSNGAHASWSTGYDTGGKAFINGGSGGSWSYNGLGDLGGFGGGGSTHGNCIGGAGGGGYSGGAGGASCFGGGGGGSYNAGINQSNSVGNSDHGKVIITQMLLEIATQSPANATKFQNNYIDVNWTPESLPSGVSISKYEIRVGTTSGGTQFVPVTNKGTATSHRITVPAGTPGNTTIYWSVRAYTDSSGTPGPWREQTVIYSNNVPTITATPNTPVNLDVSLEKRNHQFSINSLKDPDDFNYVTMFADVLDSGGTVVPGSKKQIVLDSSLINSPSLIGGTSTEKDGSLQGPLNHTIPFNLKISLQPDFTTGKFDLTLTKSDGVTNVIKSGQKLLTGRTMQPSSASAPESFTLRVYPEDRQNTNTLASAPLAGVNDVTEITIPFTSDTRNYLPNLTNVKHDVADRVFSDAEGFNRISVTGHVDDSDPADTVTMYYEIQPKATNYTIQVKNDSGKMVPKFGVATQTFNPKVDKDFAFTYQVSPDLESGDYALLVYGYDSQEGIGDYVEIPFTVDRGGPTIDFVADYTTAGGQSITMSSAQKQLVASDNKAKIYFTPNNYATFEYAGYLIRSGAVKDMRIRGAFTNEVKATFIGVDFGKDPITLMNGEQTDFKLGDVIVFKFKATSATGIVTQKDVRILIADDNSTFDPINDANLPNIP